MKKSLEKNMTIAIEDLINSFANLSKAVAKRWNVEEHDLLKHFTNELFENNKKLTLTSLIKKIENHENL